MFCEGILLTWLQSNGHTRHLVRDHCAPTRPKTKRPRSLADIPQAVLHKEIFRFDALQSENDHLRSEVARLRKILTQPSSSSAEIKYVAARRHLTQVL